jgi:hypothetical protein
MTHWKRMFGGINLASRALPSIGPYLGPIVAPTPDAALLLGSCPDCEAGSPATSVSQGTISATTVNVRKAYEHYSVTPPQGPGGGPVAVSYPDPDHGWILAWVQGAVGPQAADVIYVSSNGGRTWTEQLRSPSLPFWPLSLVPQIRGQPRPERF